VAEALLQRAAARDARALAPRLLLVRLALLRGQGDEAERLYRELLRAPGASGRADGSGSAAGR